MAAIIRPIEQDAIAIAFSGEVPSRFAAENATNQ